MERRCNNMTQQYTLLPNSGRCVTTVVARLTLMSVNANKAVDIPSGNAAQQAQLQLYSPNGTAAQQWFVKQGLYSKRTYECHRG